MGTQKVLELVPTGSVMPFEDRKYLAKYSIDLLLAKELFSKWYDKMVYGVQCIVTWIQIKFACVASYKDCGFYFSGK